MLEKKDDLQKKLGDWLDTQGYPLEMEVAAAFQRADFHTIQAEYYADPDSGVLREVDLVALGQTDIDGVLVRVAFAIECKTSKNKPWVFFTSHQRSLADRARVVQRAASALGSRYFMRISTRKELQDLPLFQLGDRPAYGLTQSFVSSTDVTYAAINVAAKAAVALARQAAEAARLKLPICEIVFPVVVLDGRLFEYYLADQRKVLSEVPRGVLLWRNPVVEPAHTIVHISTVSALGSFLNDAVRAAEALLSSHSSEIGKIKGR